MENPRQDVCGICRRLGIALHHQRAIEIISEASRRLPEEAKSIRPEIDWRSIAGIGSVPRHEYHTISDKVIWDVVQVELLPLKAAIEAIGANIKE